MPQTWKHSVVFLLGCSNPTDQSFGSTIIIVCSTLPFAEGYFLTKSATWCCDSDSCNVAEKPQMNSIINRIMQLKHKQHCTKIYVDGANPEVIRELKSRIGEYHDYYGRLTEQDIWSLRSSNSWQIIPVNFQKRHREMLQWTYTLMPKRFIKIHPSLQSLIVSLRTAIVSDDWKLDKQQSSQHDTLDSFMLSLCNYELPKHSA